ncbi:MAG TPA: hypothetical protein VK149_04180 [Sideroxyarcus sp.]|nr:hypothetical protein [Sideroxyarcus sp.]
MSTPWTVYERQPDGSESWVIKLPSEHIAQWYADTHPGDLIVRADGNASVALFEDEVDE